MVRFLADSTYDGSAVMNCLEVAFGAEVEVIIPPPKTAVIDLNDRRDAHIEHITELGRMAWQSETGVQQPRLRRSPDQAPENRYRPQVNRQITETKITTKSLNRMNRLGRAVFKHVG